jgi:hypothetical protein
MELTTIAIDRVKPRKDQRSQNRRDRGPTAAIDDVGEVLAVQGSSTQQQPMPLRNAPPETPPMPPQNRVALTFPLPANSHTAREHQSAKNSMCSSQRPAVQISNRTVVMTWQTPVCSIAIAPPYNLDVSCLFRPPLTATSVHSPNKTTTAHQRLARPSRSPKRVFSRLVSN